MSKRFSSLLETNPSLAKEWHPTKNKFLTPKDVRSYSNKKVWWKCRESHIWEASINSRFSGRGCPFCSGKRVTAKTCLKVINPGLARIWHSTKNDKLTPADVLPKSNKKVWWQCEKGHEWQSAIAQTKRCPYCSGIWPSLEESLSVTHPNIAEEWHPLKNTRTAPYKVIFSSGKIIWWKCINNHEWQASIKSRVIDEACPYCLDRIANIENCLATQYPDLVKQWHPSKNNFTAYDVTRDSNRKAWWICDKRHEWRAFVNVRADGQDCPVCFRVNKNQYIHRRNFRFKHNVEVSDKSKILGVAIDPSGNFHRVIIFNFLGRIIEQPFSIDTLKKGYDLLVNKIGKSKTKIGATEIHIGIESAGGYSENLINHLSMDFDNVVTIAATNVADNRKQRSLGGLKSDDIDCGAIGDLLIRGEFNKIYPESIVYYKLKNLVYWREKKLVLRRTLKNHITARFKRIYPGLNSDFNEDKKVYGESYTSILHLGLLRCGMLCEELINTPDEVLARKFGYNGFHLGKRAIASLKVRLNEMLFPDKAEATAHLAVLKRDVRLLEYLEREISDIEKEIVVLGKQTSAKYLMGQIKGLTDLFASMYVGVIGNIKKYKSAKHIYSYSGLSPKLSQSGESAFQSSGIKKRGNILLRAILFKITSYVIVSDPFYKDYLQKLKKEKDRHWKKNRIAVCRRINNVLFALIRDKTAFIGKSLEVPITI